VHLSGLIRIAREAQDTDDFLELRVLTLDEAARATAEPKLEIEANQVKASHAASVGPVDPEQILYLESRGLTSERAVALLVDSWLMIES
jgi:Fe-S cluster assembly protein SufD